MNETLKCGICEIESDRDSTIRIRADGELLCDMCNEWWEAIHNRPGYILTREKENESCRRFNED